MTDVQRNLEPKNRDKFTQVAVDCMYCFVALCCSTILYVLLSKSDGNNAACLLPVCSTQSFLGLRRI